MSGYAGSRTASAVCVCPVGMTQHLVTPVKTFGPGAYHRDLIIIDEHTGTQFDTPAHFIPPPASGPPEGGSMGWITGEKLPAWQFRGEACVIDLTEHVTEAKDGTSFLITPEMVQVVRLLTFSSAQMPVSLSLDNKNHTSF